MLEKTETLTMKECPECGKGLIIVDEEKKEDKEPKRDFRKEWDKGVNVFIGLEEKVNPDWVRELLTAYEEMEKENKRHSDSIYRVCQLNSELIDQLKKERWEHKKELEGYKAIVNELEKELKELEEVEYEHGSSEALSSVRGIRVTYDELKSKHLKLSEGKKDNR